MCWDRSDLWMLEAVSRPSSGGPFYGRTELAYGALACVGSVISTLFAVVGTVIVVHGGSAFRLIVTDVGSPGGSHVMSSLMLDIPDPWGS